MMERNNNFQPKPGIMFSSIRGGLGRTLFILFMAISLIPVILVSYISYKTSYNSLYDDAVNSLSAVAKIKNDYIASYFSEKFRDVSLQAGLNSNKHVFQLLRDSFHRSGLTADEFIKSNEWNIINSERCKDFNNFQNTYGYADLFLIDEAGNILFTSKKSDDLGTNIFSGKYS